MTQARQRGRLDGRVAIVTGAGSGIGEACAARLAAEGATVVVNDIESAAARATVDFIRASGGRAEACVGDVRISSFVDELVHGATGRHGRLDVMHNNAGGGAAAELMDVTDEAWRDALTLNVSAVFYGIRAALRVMVPAGAGSIISTASVAGINAAKGIGPYSSAKAALMQLTRTAAIEYAAFGVRINAVAPGSIRTPAAESMVAGSPLGMDGWSRPLPQGRFGEPDEVASVVAWLASEEASYVNGATIVVDGAISAKLAFAEP